ncbi:N-acylglucosamine 2-epimerase (GlcNAc 2-epimerase) [Haladaptatus litoreus]|uniref:N-acylglucosamine 2-epimerase (GlcNAc 2-epimerase) n=1 Tax=Haladaptatus litoreus TaxID=553468 RepID=A0A1N7F2J1_9EURY|nr:AGE family epimerase/isomerase [Haladaptatus litoreus]SIR94570.1 N-acylglucosamine 2-epimerase (GlcNAc 2-epimerase) [Haladaptatus litoreus]
MTTPNYRDPRVLRQQRHRVLNFYYPDCIDTRYGGYIAQLNEREGFVYDRQTKHLVATARTVHNFSVGTLIDGSVWCQTAAEHGLTFLSNHHWDDDNKGREDDERAEALHLRTKDEQ